MDNTNDNPNEEQTSRLQQPAVGGSLPPAQQMREWQAKALVTAQRCDRHNLYLAASVSEAMAKAYGQCAELLERQ